jgi:hypothetical protein
MILEIVPNIWLALEPISKDRLVDILENIQISKNSAHFANVDSIFEDETALSHYHERERNVKIKSWKYHLEELYLYHKAWKKIILYSTKNNEWVIYYFITWLMWNAELPKDKAISLFRNKIQLYYHVYHSHFPHISSFWNEIFRQFEL